MNMDANLIFANSTSPNALSLGASQPANGVDINMSSPMTGQEFAGVMRDLMTNAERQGFATPVGETGLEMATPSLQTLNLGNQISLITSASPLPDAGSLAEFARSQGLGESAVKALFGDLAAQISSNMPGKLSANKVGEPPLTELNGLSGLSGHSALQLQLSNSSNLEPTITLATTAPVLGTLQISEVQENDPATPADISMSNAFPSTSTLTWLANHPSAMPAGLEGPKVSNSMWEAAPHPSLNLMAKNSIPNTSQLTTPQTNIPLLSQQQATQAELPSGFGLNSNTSLKVNAAISADKDQLDIANSEAASESNINLSNLNQMLVASQASGTLQNAAPVQPTPVTSLPMASHSNLAMQPITTAEIHSASVDSSSQDPVSLNLPLMAGTLLSQVVSKAVDPANSSIHIQPASESPVEMGPLDVMRMRMVPAWETMTRQLAKLNGNDTPTTWANLATAALKSDSNPTSIPQATIDLGFTDIGIDLQSDLNIALTSSTFDSSSVTVTPSNAEPSRSTHSLIGPSSSNSSAAVPLEDRASQIQQLGEKLGQAMSERLQEQMEKGQWRLHLKLNPGHLGSIDVELDMHSGGLDALFKTENALTRELITSGMSKLREGLAQSGTAVASVWVNSDSQRESGGNSTPRQNTFSENNVKAVNTDTPHVAQVHKELRSADGWDTLA